MDCHLGVRGGLVGGGEVGEVVGEGGETRIAVGEGGGGWFVWLGAVVERAVGGREVEGGEDVDSWVARRSQRCSQQMTPIS